MRDEINVLLEYSYIYWVEIVKLVVWIFGIFNCERIVGRKNIYILLGGNIILMLAQYGLRNDELLEAMLVIILLGVMILLQKKRHDIGIVIFSFIIQSVLDLLIPVIVAEFSDKNIIDILEMSDIPTIYNLVSVPVVFIIFIVSCYTRRNNAMYNTKYSWKDEIYIILLAVAIFIFALITLLTTKYMLEHGEFISAQYYTLYILLALFASGGYAFFRVKELKEYYKNNNLTYQILLKEQVEYHNKVIEHNRETRKIYHDMKNHIQCLKILLEKGDINKATEYLSTIDEKVESINVQVISGHPIIDIVIHNIQAEYPEVCLKWRGIISPNIKITDIDLCILFSNLLKNAIESTIMANSEKTIDMEVYIVKNNMIIKGKNDYIDDGILKNQGLISKKKDKNSHGYGVENIKDVVNKYNGSFEYYIREKFEIEIVLENIL